VNLLDENFPENQCRLLRKWGIHVRRVGRDFAEFGADDEKLIPLLHKLKGVTFLTHDQDFFQKRLRHPAYCLVWLDTDEDAMAAHARRFLRHKLFASKALRMGVVARVNVGGVQYRRKGRAHRYDVRWAP